MTIGQTNSITSFPCWVCHDEPYEFAYFIISSKVCSIHRDACCGKLSKSSHRNAVHWKVSGVKLCPLIVFWSVYEHVCVLFAKEILSERCAKEQTKMTEKEKRSYWRVPSTSLGWCPDCKPFVKCVVYEFSSFAYKFLRKSLSLYRHHWQYITSMK